MIEVLAIPPLATVQDLGRDGHWSQGLGRAGAMDGLAHRAANLLLGNAECSATVEIPMTPAKFHFGARQAFAIAGAACEAKLADRRLPRVWAGMAEAGDVLELGAINRGARIYLALPGGIDVPEILGSRSTQLREAFGGLEGRVLYPGDTLKPADTSEIEFPRGGLSLSLPPLRPSGQDDITLRVLLSTEHDSFTKESLQVFWSTHYEVTRQSNRQGYRLEGKALSRKSTGELRSHGIVPGIIQVPSGGQPIIQLADSATMGGYPKIGAVIEPDLWRIAQARPGDRLRFVQATPAEAAHAAHEQTKLIDHIRACLADFRSQQRSWA